MEKEIEKMVKEDYKLKLDDLNWDLKRELEELEVENKEKSWRR